MADLSEFLKRRDEIAREYVNGEFQSLGGILTHRHPATFFSPAGDVVEDARTVADRYKRDAGLFETGSESELKVLQAFADDGIAYWVGYQRAIVRMHGKPEPVRMRLRVTEIFRQEDGDWKLVHRHADMLGA